MGTFSDSAMGNAGAVPMPVLPLYPNMGSEGQRSFIRAGERCEYAMFIQRQAGSMPQMSHLCHAVTTTQAFQTVRGSLGGSGPRKNRFFVACYCVHTVA